jgi:hypothetical protein
MFLTEPLRVDPHKCFLLVGRSYNRHSRPEIPINAMVMALRNEFGQVSWHQRVLLRDLSDNLEMEHQRVMRGIDQVLRWRGFVNCVPYQAILTFHLPQQSS